MPKSSSSRSPKNPPHIPLGALRIASGKKLADICKSIEETLGVDKVHPGTISAIESGTRGASQPMLEALAVAYGLRPGDIVTDYEPRVRELPEAI